MERGSQLNVIKIYLFFFFNLRAESAQQAFCFLFPNLFSLSLPIKFESSICSPQKHRNQLHAARQRKWREAVCIAWSYQRKDRKFPRRMQIPLNSKDFGKWQINEVSRQLNLILTPKLMGKMKQYDPLNKVMHCKMGAVNRPWLADMF